MSHFITSRRGLIAAQTSISEGGSMGRNGGGRFKSGLERETDVLDAVMLVGFELVFKWLRGVET